MQQELQLTLFVIGVIAIAGVLLHGLWKIRKSSSSNKKQRYENRNWEPGFEQEDDLHADGPLYDDVGVGKARVVLNPSQEQTKEPDVEDSVSIDLDAEIENPELEDIAELSVADSESSSKSNKNNELSHEIVELEITEEFEPTIESVDSVKLATENTESVSNEEEVDANLEDTNLETVDDAVEVEDENKVLVGAPEPEDTEAPVYSNVVTQPKPEYTKPQYTKDKPSDIGSAPPAFLLKKSSDSDAETPVDKANAAQSEDEFKSVENTNLPHEKSLNDANIDKPLEKEAEPEPDFSLNIQEGPITPEKESATATKGVEKELSFAEQAKRFVRRNKKTVADKIRKEPVIAKKQADDQMRINFNETTQDTSADDAADVSKKSTNDKAATESQSTSNAQTDVLVLNVRSSDDNPIQGAALLPMLLTLGFKFGEHDIFHRHVNTNGKGPILFSLTNMFKPGVFDIDNIENFSTYGVSLFMMLPIEGDAQQVFNMMHNAARKISDEFSCRILDGNKVGLSKQSLQQYVERIREFERKRITQE